MQMMLFRFTEQNQTHETTDANVIVLKSETIRTAEPSVGCQMRKSNPCETSSSGEMFEKTKNAHKNRGRYVLVCVCVYTGRVNTIDDIISYTALKRYRAYRHVSVVPFCMYRTRSAAPGKKYDVQYACSETTTGVYYILTGHGCGESPAKWPKPHCAEFSASVCFLYAIAESASAARWGPARHSRRARHGRRLDGRGRKVFSPGRASRPLLSGCCRNASAGADAGVRAPVATTRFHLLPFGPRDVNRLLRNPTTASSCFSVSRRTYSGTPPAGRRFPDRACTPHCYDIPTVVSDTVKDTHGRTIPSEEFFSPSGNDSARRTLFDVVFFSQSVDRRSESQNFFVACF